MDGDLQRQRKWHKTVPVLLRLPLNVSAPVTISALRKRTEVGGAAKMPGKPDHIAGADLEVVRLLKGVVSKWLHVCLKPSYDL